MIVVLLVVGVAVALCVAGWIPTVRQALRADIVLPGPTINASPAATGTQREPDAQPVAATATTG